MTSQTTKTRLDYELAIHDLKVITEPNPPAEGIRVAMIEHNGAPIELIEFEKNKRRSAKIY